MHAPRIVRAFVLASPALALACASTETRFSAEETPSAPVAGPATQGAAKKLLTLAELYDPSRRVDFSGQPQSGFVWLDDEHYLWPRRAPKSRAPEWLRVEAATGETQPFADADVAKRALAKIPGVTEEQAARLAFSDTSALSKRRDAVLVDVRDDLWHYTYGADAPVRLTNTPDAGEDNAQLSPDGKRVSFVRANDLYCVDVATRTEERLTTDGSELVLNGKLDWLYQEEVYGRGNYQAHWWSPDSSTIAFLRLDETGVPLYTLVDDVSEPIRVETSPYPRPGERNPAVSLGLATPGSGAAASAPRFVDLARFQASEPLIVDVAWSPRGVLHFSVQDREQTWLELCALDSDARSGAASASARTLLRETTRAWVDNHGSPTWLADGSFLWFSERDGWKHLYRHAPDGALVGAVTQGAWEARTLHGVDERNGWVYFSGTERSPTGSDVYRVKLDGTQLTRLTQTRGTHSASFNPGFTRFLDSWSDVQTPAQVRLHGADGAEQRVVDANAVPALADYALVTPEFHRVPTRDGFEMEALLLKPLNFDPSRKYPVFQWTYAGPHSQSVLDRFGRDGMFLQLLAQRGIAVWLCDNRTASGKGAQSAWPCYQQLGVQELLDIEDGLEWLAKQGWADMERVGIGGWSYGGFMASYALTHSKRFRCGVAGGSVTAWNDYDSIYTERFMKTPKNNPSGYARTSVVAAAKDLHGALLLVHGAIDDNVHPGNTQRLAYALQQAGKPFELQLYAKSRHGVVDPKLNLHWRATMLAFLEEHLLARAAAPQG